MNHQKINIIFMLSCFVVMPLFAPIEDPWGLVSPPDRPLQGPISGEDSDWVLVSPAKSMPSAGEKQESTLPKTTAKTTRIQPSFQVKRVPVLQQKSDKPFFLHGTNLETENDGTVFGQPGLFWKNVRTGENMNCGYHALKNVRTLMNGLQDPRVNVSADLANPRSLLHQQLNAPDHLIPDLASWSNDVYQKRKNSIYKDLQKAPEDNPAALKRKRDFLQSDTLKSYVNVNDGYIKVDDLGGEELEKLIKTEVPAIKHNVVVMEYTPGIPGILLDEQVQMSPAMQARVAKFQSSQNDVMGILWNEEDLGHWVGYVAHKENGQVTIYAMNSSAHREPQNISKLYAMLR